MTIKKQATLNKTLPEQPSAPWDPLVGVIFILAVFFATQFVASAIVYIYPLIKHMTQHQANDWLNSSIIGQFIFILLAETMAVGAVYLFLKKKYKLGLSAIGLKKPRWRDPVWGVFGFLLFIFLYAIVVQIVKHFAHGLDVSQKQNVGFSHVSGNPQLVLSFISLVVLPPIAEEIMVRGFLYTSLKKAMPMVYAALLTSVMFGAAHLQEGVGGLLWIGFIDTFVLSLVLIYLRERTGSLWASITLHALHNGVTFVNLFVLHAR